MPHLSLIYRGISVRTNLFTVMINLIKPRKTEELSRHVKIWGYFSKLSFFEERPEALPVFFVAGEIIWWVGECCLGPNLKQQKVGLKFVNFDN